MANMRNKLTTSKEQIKEAYENGATLREIGDVHGTSSGTVRNCLIEMGITLRPRGRRKRQDVVNERVLPVDDLSADTSETE